MDIAGLVISFVGVLLMIPESLRLTSKNPDDGIRWKSNIPGSKFAPKLFIFGIILIAIGFMFQLIASV